MHALILISLLSGSSQPDAWLTTKAKLALWTTAGVSSTAVSVDVIDGTVTLHGKVGTAEERQRAEAEVAKVDGVHHIRNLLQVVPDYRRSIVDATDSTIKDNISRALKDDKSLSDSTISVQSVDNGVVLLTGRAASLTDHLRAVETADGTPGVRKVRSEIQSPDRLADEKIWRDRDSNPKLEAFSDGSSDVWMTSEVKMRLLADSKVPAMDVSVDTRRGVVTLFGIVNSEEAVTSAVADAHKIKGVREVHNELQIVSSARAEDIKTHDKDVKKEIANAMKDDNDLKHVDISVKNGVARLTGSVPTSWDRIHAATLTRSLKGVKAVNDDLHVKRD